jgi:hypothetical protein
MTKHESTGNASATTLEALVANTCFCKLKTSCSDKNSSDCMRHKNIYAEFMQQKSEATKR